MKTETHYKLALNLCDRLPTKASKPQKAAFVTGCIMPDVNPFSYLRGFSVRPFYGHNWQNCKGFILSSAKRLGGGYIGYYGLGVLVHYLCDAFTHTHNTAFKEGLKQHNQYEKRLHDFIMKADNRLYNENLKAASLPQQIEAMHKDYESTVASYESDTTFILRAVNGVVMLFNQRFGVKFKALR